jgi:hypothetical protein
MVRAPERGRVGWPRAGTPRTPCSAAAVGPANQDAGPAKSREPMSRWSMLGRPASSSTTPGRMTRQVRPSRQRSSPGVTPAASNCSRLTTPRCSRVSARSAAGRFPPRPLPKGSADPAWRCRSMWPVVSCMPPRLVGDFVDGHGGSTSCGGPWSTSKGVDGASNRGRPHRALKPHRAVKPHSAVLRREGI